MSKPYEPPRHLAHLAKTVNAARTQVGWGVHDDGSVGLEHIMSSNPFAGKAKVWGIANIDDNGDIQIISNGPGNNTLDEPLPQDLVHQIVQFYEGEGLNVRNVHESDPSKKTSEVENGLKACPHCGENKDLYLHPALDSFECDNCGTIGDTDELIDFGEDPDPDRNMFEDDDDYPDALKNDDWADYEANVKTAGVSFQGAPVGGNQPASGIAVRPDRQSREEIEQMVGGLDAGSPGGIQNEFVDKMNEGMGTSFPSYDNPFVNRGGSFGADTIEDHFLEGFDKEAAPVGTPGGMGDVRNFDPQNQPGFIVVSQYLTPDDNWLFTDKCKGIVAENGGSTSHGAVVARAMGIPAVVGASEASQIQPGDHVTLDPNTGRVDVNGGNADFQEGEIMRARRERVRFAWSNGQGVFTPVTKELTPEMATAEYHPGDKDRSHMSMVEYMDDEGMYEDGNATVGVIYDDGTAEYYEPINDEPQMENWLKSTFPDLVSQVVYKQTSGGIYAPTAKAGAAEEDEPGQKSPTCPECGSHTYDVITYPDGYVGEAQLRCLNDGTVYPWTLYMNPRTSVEAPEGEDYDYECPHCGEKLTDSDLDEGVCPQCGGSLHELTAKRAMIKEAPGKKHLPYATPKRNRQYEHILESCHEEHPDWSEDRCKELAARTVNKQRAEHGETKSSEDCGCGGESKLIFRSATEIPAINDTQGQPLKIGELYLMRSTQYKVPDVVRITNINEKRIEAHIDSDVRGMFPIEIDPAEFVNLGYSFEPYVQAKEAIAAPGDEILYGGVISALRAMAEGHSYYPELMRDPHVNQAVRKALQHFGDPAHALQALNDADSFGNFLRYYSKEAARALHLSPKRQKELINENMGARARNFEKLNLEGTHYVHSYELEPRAQDEEIDAHFLW